MNETITVLTIDLSPKLAARLNRIRENLPGVSLRDVALEALDEWAARREEA